MDIRPYPKSAQVANRGKQRAPRCGRQRCGRRAEDDLLDLVNVCHHHVVIELDVWFSLEVRARDGRCTLARCYDILAERHGLAPKVCEGRLECCHRITRYRDCTRYHFDNASTGCNTHHRFFTSHPELWSEVLDLVWNAEKRQEMRDLAYGPVKFDWNGKYREVFAGRYTVQRDQGGVELPM